MPSQPPVFGGPKDGRPNPATPGENGPNHPNYGAQIDRWRDKIKPGHAKRNKVLRNKIDAAKVDRWSEKTKAAQNAPPAYDSLYNDDVAAANKTYGDAMVAQGLHNSQVQRDYGFDPAYASPYSRATALSDAWARDQRQTLNSYAAGGQLYSGARERAVSHDERAYLSDLNTAKEAYNTDVAQVAAEGPAAAEAKAQAIRDAEAAFQQRLIDNPAADPGPAPDFIKKEKRQLKRKIHDLKGDRKDAKNKFARKKIQTKIKRAKKNLSSIPGVTKDV